MDPAPTRRKFLQTVGGTAAALAATGPAPAQQQPGDWPMLGYDRANTGYNPAVTGPETQAGVQWGFELTQDIATSPAVADGRVYFGSWDTDIYALDANTGEQQWRFGTERRVESTPTVVDGTVYVGGSDSRVYAIDAESGTEEWSFETGGEVRAAPAVTRVAGSRTVYVGSWDGSVYAIDANDGSERWTFETENFVSSSPAVYDTETHGPVVFIGSDDAVLYALDAANGDELWSFGTGAPINSAPAVTDGRVHVGSRDGFLYTLDANDGAQLWEVETGRDIVASPAVTDDHVYVGSRDNVLYALARDSGEQQWTFDADSLIAETPAVAGEILYLSSDQHLSAIDANSGELLWQREAGQLTPPAVVEGRIYVGSGNTLYALSPDSDTPLVREPSGGDADEGDSGLERFRFLLWPASVLAGVGSLVGMAYVAKWTGLLAWIEETADSVGPDPSIETDESDDESDEGDEGPATPVWELVLDDVIGRAEKTEKTATEDILVTKYVDSDTLDSPVVAYEIESYRDEPVQIRLSEPLMMESPEGGSRPFGDNWTVEKETLWFEGTVEPDETIRTIVGRRDCEPDDAGELEGTPDIEIE